MSNAVIKGDYKGYIVYSERGKMWLTKMFKRIEIKKENIEAYEVVDESSQVSGSSAVLRAGAGALLLGPLGLAAALTARQKGIVTIVIAFKDGKSTVVEMDAKKFKVFKLLLV